MIDIYQKRRYYATLEFILDNKSKTLYITKDNIRQSIVNISSLNSFIKCMNPLYISDNEGHVDGIAGLWKSNNGHLTRYYLKLFSNDERIVNHLLTQVLWNFKKEIYIKLDKNYKFLNVFYNKGFKYIGNRGTEILLFINNLPKKSYDLPSK